MRKIFVTIVISSTIVLAGCNTVQGAGQDIESVGDEAEEVINE
ncbi:entericidin A/B family lipoprotein [Parasphingorhabdus cellanae]|uniref:Entericidin A/B family lipoprotein n=1 Tax=Parasphingorhabdus cellanae TaxID=2806553 RepID=A0ABX7T5M3_9SPHN|nr:entericidin A/B family lipoprotein [Parasphingorhabdus cellanae]QTD55545.1 entericidin A/B family lipoprotein [Parasphingorhabdus cellanae]